MSLPAATKTCSPTTSPPPKRTFSPPPPNVDFSGLERLSLQERKCALVDRELDAYGMGRYQWYIWCLCGFGYFLDLLWAQAFGLVLSPLQQELGFDNRQSGNISTSFNAGLTAGAFFWGFMADIVGRRWAFNLTCLLSSIFGLCLGAANTYDSFLVLTAFVGFGVGGNIPVDGAIFLEFVPQNRRFLLACLSIFQPAGVIVCSALAFAFIPSNSCSPNFSEASPLPSCRTAALGVDCCARADNMGWRYLLFTLGGLTLFVFFIRTLIFTCQETPKFLIYRGQDAKAIETMTYVAKTNNTPCNLTLDVFDFVQSQHDYENVCSELSPLYTDGRKLSSASPSKKLRLGLSRFSILFSSPRMTAITTLTWLTYILDFGGFTIASFYLPRILALKNGAASISLRHTYASYIYCYVPGILAVLLGAYASHVPAIGQKWTMVASSACMGASIFLLSQVDSPSKSEGFFVLEYFFQSMFNAVLYGWTPQAFPAPIRGTACGIASFWGRLFGIVSPLIAQSLYGNAEGGGSGGTNGVLYLAGGVTLGCVLTTALLPTRLPSESGDEDTRRRKSPAEA